MKERRRGNHTTRSGGSQCRHARQCVARLVVAAGAVFATPAGASHSSHRFLSDLIRRQTEEFSKAGKAGDKAAIDRLLDPEVVFTNEDGSMPTRADLVDGATPAQGKFSLVVTDFKLRPQGDVATATFVDVLTEDFHGLSLRTDYHSTEVWAKRPTGWKMIASHTTVVPHDPAPIELPIDQLRQYVGAYRLGRDIKVEITLDNGTLFASTNGGAKHAMKVEAPDLLYLPGVGSGRRYFQRSADGRVTGYVTNVNGNDLLVSKIT